MAKRTLVCKNCGSSEFSICVSVIKFYRIVGTPDNIDYELEDEDEQEAYGNMECINCSRTAIEENLIDEEEYLNKEKYSELVDLTKNN